VTRGSPADKSGLREGDRLLRVSGAAVTSGREVVDAVAMHAVGDVVDVVYVRDGHEASTRAILASFPSVEELMRMDLVGAPAPSWGQVQVAAGSFPASLSRLKGRVVLVDFWATWCVPCRIVMPKLSQLQARHGAEGLTVVGLAADDPSAVLSYVRSQSPGYAIGIDTDAETSRRYGITSLPTVVVVDKQGIVRDVLIGYDPTEDVRLESTVRQLLATRPAP
jgi:thiol-disulfide isomerase/thioredoxin